MEEALTDALRRIEGAFSLVVLTPDHIYAVRDPRGFRPLSMGRIKGTMTQPDATVFASETTAFDLIGATWERDLEPGEIIVVEGQNQLRPGSKVAMRGAEGRRPTADGEGRTVPGPDAGEGKGGAPAGKGEGKAP